MWVVMLGDRLATDPCLPQWLALLDELGGGRVTVVAGGGGFADEGRRLQAHWQLDALTAHNIAVLATVQAAYQLLALQPTLRPALGSSAIHRVLRSGHTALWLPLELLRERPAPAAGLVEDAQAMALALARALNAERLVLVETGHGTAPDPAAGDGAACPVSRLQGHQLQDMRALLLGAHRGPPG